MAFYYGLVSQRGPWRTTPHDIQHLITPGPYTSFINPINQLGEPLFPDEPQVPQVPQIPQIPQIPIQPNPQDPAFTPQPTPQAPPPSFTPQPTPQAPQVWGVPQIPQPAPQAPPVFGVPQQAANPASSFTDYDSGFTIEPNPTPPIAAEPRVKGNITNISSSQFWNFSVCRDI